MPTKLPDLPPPPIGALTSGEVALLRAWADDHARAAIAQAGAEPVAWRAKVESMWFHAANKDALVQSLALQLARTPDEIHPLYAAPTAPAPLDCQEQAQAVAAAYCRGHDAGRQSCKDYKESLPVASAPLPAREPLTLEQMSDCAWGYVPDSRSLSEAAIGIIQSTQLACAEAWGVKLDGIAATPAAQGDAL